MVRACSKSCRWQPDGTGKPLALARGLLTLLTGKGSAFRDSCRGGIPATRLVTADKRGLTQMKQQAQQRRAARCDRQRLGRAVRRSKVFTPPQTSPIAGRGSALTPTVACGRPRRSVDTPATNRNEEPRQRLGSGTCVAPYSNPCSMMNSEAAPRVETPIFS